MSVKIACEIMWANDAVEINKTYNKNNTKYAAKISRISEKAKQKLEADYGMKIKNDDKGGRGLHFNAKSNYPFAFVSQGGNAIDAKSIGNGSKAIVEVTGSYEHAFVSAHGKAPMIKSTIVITELVKYEPKGDDSNNAPFDADETL